MLTNDKVSFKTLTAAGICESYTDWAAGIWFLVEQGMFLFGTCPDSEVHQTSSPVGTSDSLPKSKVARVQSLPFTFI
jgi:hypothetical protein